MLVSRIATNSPALTTGISRSQSEEISGFADGADHIHFFFALGIQVHWHNLVMRAVERWTDEIVHAGVDDEEALVVVPLAIENTGD